MINNYYTPEAEEYHINCRYFIYEPKEEIEDLNLTKWEQRTLSTSQDLSVILGNKPAIKKMKYLDQADIEELGWKYKKTNGMHIWYEGDKVNWFNTTIPSGDSGRYWDFQLIHDPKYKTVKIECLTNYGEWEVFFEGKVKNFNELQKLMKQLNIK